MFFLDLFVFWLDDQDEAADEVAEVDEQDHRQCILYIQYIPLSLSLFLFLFLSIIYTCFYFYCILQRRKCPGSSNPALGCCLMQLLSSFRWTFRIWNFERNWDLSTETDSALASQAAERLLDTMKSLAEDVSSAHGVGLNDAGGNVHFLDLE